MVGEKSRKDREMLIRHSVKGTKMSLRSVSLGRHGVKGLAHSCRLNAIRSTRVMQQTEKASITLLRLLFTFTLD